MSPKRALITGITGQDGSYLAELLLDKGYEVHGLVRRASTFNRGRIDHLFSDPYAPNKPIRLHYGDLCDSNSLLRVLKLSKPDEVYNLAAQSHVAVSFDIPEYTGDSTGLGTTRLLEALRTSGLESKFYQASSSELYGKILETPQNEQTPFYPRSPYGCAKAYAFYLTRNYRESYNMYAVNGILFNHESPRRSENFVTRKITLSLAQILSGKMDKLYLGNLDAKRDWGYAKEYVEGMWRMLQQEKPDDYVLATGETHSVREFLELCLNYANISFEKRGDGINEEYINTKTGKTIVAIDERYYRAAEVDILLGDASKAKNELGWEPKTMVSDLAKLMIESDFAEMGVSL
ncbi:GDP-mannose 4,6-dehydratase [Candidatus Peregrinibacteria bacterium]|nr:GDP-mannose 4,6-dehydratase [Candidatus Peregrinibacteria bacterium]MBT3598688.1 GDP-mannose 4,6-dehydratase [Candidatus Peregrinibacteria bacterium]MBT6730464.1 GDP-mannose 4,6-dehydratase [Candidatus Peregrinibacteria bacterium]MBT7009920.1 GDP-mannose 4,6-dehydratase [Candidatus Peregrinibacteria bacterium]MBT7345407.1 GDP-mannose 4,6-dehydratase [Candidatus Peregrinibacteria bacterium]